MLKHNFQNHAQFSPNCKHKLQLSKTISQNFGFLLQKQTIASKQFVLKVTHCLQMKYNTVKMKSQ